VWNEGGRRALGVWASGADAEGICEDFWGPAGGGAEAGRELRRLVREEAGVINYNDDLRWALICFTTDRPRARTRATPSVLLAFPRGLPDCGEGLHSTRLELEVGEHPERMNHQTPDLVCFTQQLVAGRIPP
jgi:hypothetical protein